MISYKQFRAALKTVNEYRVQEQERLNKIDAEIGSALKKGPSLKQGGADLDEKLVDTKMSVRLLNILKYGDLGITINHQTKVSELAKVSITAFKRCRKSGKKSLQELREFCLLSGIKLLP